MKIDFNEAARDLPLDRSALAKRIAETPLDVVLEYVSVLQQMKSNLDQYIAIMHASGSPLCEALMSQVADEKLGDLQIITEILNTDNILAQIDRLIASTWGTATKEKANAAKVDQFCTLVDELERVGLDRVSLLIWSKHLEIGDFLRALWFYRTKKDKEALKGYLAFFSDERLDSLISTAMTGLNIFESHS
jgi:hypothetical protein